MTNFERLKAKITEMSEEEFINLIPFAFEYFCGLIPECHRMESGHPTNCYDCQLEWLKSEVKEDKP